MQPICYWIMGLALHNHRSDPPDPAADDLETRIPSESGRLVVGDLMGKWSFSFIVNVIYKVDYIMVESTKFIIFLNILSCNCFVIPG